jgi:hypothetical protein
VSAPTIYVVEARDSAGEWTPLPQFSACNQRSAEAQMERARNGYGTRMLEFRLVEYARRRGRAKGRTP